MKPILAVLSVLICVSANSQAIEALYDHDNSSGTFDIVSMFGSEDSLYAVESSGGENGWGAFIKWPKAGGDFEIIYSFDEINNNPISIVGNDTVIYGTTRASGSGQLFKYSLTTYKFEFLHEFSLAEAQFPEIKYITDSLLWGFSELSSEDEGNVFTIGLDGTGFNKRYSNSNETLGRQFGDIHIQDGYIFIACRTGGGIPYDPGDGLTGSGSVIRVDLDGGNYLKLMEGASGNGTDPRSLLWYENRLYVLFYSAGTDSGGRFGYTTFDGSEGEIGFVVPDPVGELSVQDGIILINSLNELMVYDPISTGVRSVFFYDNNGWEGPSAGPSGFNNGSAISFTNGGQSTAGGILVYTNSYPTLAKPLDFVVQEGFQEFDVNLSDGFFDDDSFITSIAFEPVSGPSAGLVYDNSNVKINVTELGLGFTLGTIQTTDNGLLTLEAELSVFVNAPVETLKSFEDTLVQVGFEDLSYQLDNFFTDRNGDEVNFSVSSSDETVVSAELINGAMVISSFAAGTAIVTVNASDSRGGDLTVSFQVINNGNPEGEINDILTNEGFESKSLALNDFYSDPNNDDLQFDIEVSDESVVTTDLSEGILTINELGHGPVDVTINVDDLQGGTFTDTFTFDVNRHPILNESVEVITVIEGFGSATIDLSGKFSDPDEDEISYTILNSNQEAIEAEIENEVISITEKAFGKATLEIVAEDGRGGTLSIPILDLILGSDKSSNQRISIYPNPTESVIYINQQHSDPSDIRIIDMAGKVVFMNSFTSELSIEVSGWSKGLYLLELSDLKKKRIVSRKIMIK